MTNLTPQPLSDDERYSWLNIWELPQTPDGIRDLLLRYDDTVNALAVELEPWRELKAKILEGRRQAEEHPETLVLAEDYFIGRFTKERDAINLALGEALAALHPLKGQLDPYEFGEDVVARVEGMLTTDAAEAAQQAWARHVAMHQALEAIARGDNGACAHAQIMAQEALGGK